MKVYAQPVGFALLSLTERQKAWGIGYQTNLVKFNQLKTKKQTNKHTKTRCIFKGAVSQTISLTWFVILFLVLSTGHLMNTWGVKEALIEVNWDIKMLASALRVCLFGNRARQTISPISQCLKISDNHLLFCHYI